MVEAMDLWYFFLAWNSKKASLSMIIELLQCSWQIKKEDVVIFTDDMYWTKVNNFEFTPSASRHYIVNHHNVKIVPILVVFPMRAPLHRQDSEGQQRRGQADLAELHLPFPSSPLVFNI